MVAFFPTTGSKSKILVGYQRYQCITVSLKGMPLVFQMFQCRFALLAKIVEKKKQVECFFSGEQLQVSFHLTPLFFDLKKNYGAQTMARWRKNTVPGISSFDVFSASIALYLCQMWLDLPKLLGRGHVACVGSSPCFTVFQAAWASHVYVNKLTTALFRYRRCLVIPRI